MAYLEIERKFLVKGEYKSLAFEVTRIKQGYIASGNGRTVRVRIRDSKGYLTIKGPSDVKGLGRFEWEKEISVEEAEALLTIAEPGTISKSRYLVRADDGHVWEVDEFYGENEGLTMAEIELKSEEEPFTLPSFIGREVTGDRRFYNSHMRKNPYRLWKQDINSEAD
jgi:CYTH domain-containing protein